MDIANGDTQTSTEEVAPLTTLESATAVSSAASSEIASTSASGTNDDTDMSTITDQPETAPTKERSGSTPSQQETQHPQPATKPSTASATAPAPAAPLKRRPRRTGQPLHLLFQDCSKQHISGYLCKKTPEEITAIVSDKKALAVDLQNYSNEFVLTSARDRVIAEVDEQGKELLKDVDPEKDVIKQRFEDESSVFKSYEDAIHDIRVDLYLDGIKPRKESDESSEDITLRNAELNAVLQVWDVLYKRVEIEPRRAGRATQAPFPGRTGGAPGAGTRPHPYAPSRFPASPPYGPGHFCLGMVPVLRDYHDRPPHRDDYYPDRRDDYRRPGYDHRDPRDPMALRAPGPIPLGRPDARDMRDPRDYRDRPPPPVARGEVPYGAGSGRYDDRRRDRLDLSNAPPPRDNRPYGSNGATASPLTAHPSLPPKPHGSHFDASSAQSPTTSALYPQHYPTAPQQHPSHIDAHSVHVAYNAYGQQQPYPASGHADYAGYAYAGYQDPAGMAAQSQQYAYASGATGDWTMAAGAGHHVQTFASTQPGRHMAVPLPTDFMSGPSEAPRLSMPEPHEVLGTIRGVIIRDAHGNIGLSQYQFYQAT
ncbi:hypothetical protein BGZ70_007057 [Mortierella alpina]|uniref:Uncharacterized protein n=1 Tax=Mortierella alpina TaxID=64518 RepID=A0A9P6JE10_MORAP|nr:hypothetical protein BGZ70_007057 [Mortierella alpina]